MLSVEFVSRTEIHRYAVLDDAVLFKDGIEHFERPASVDHEILRDDLKPIDDRLFRENVPVMWHAQADPNAAFCESVEGICRHSLQDVLQELGFHALDGTGSVRSAYS